MVTDTDLGGLLLVAEGIRTLAAPVEGASDAGEGPVPRAMRLEHGRITWVGANPASAPPAARRIDLGGAWLTPAFVDAHVHATATGLGRLGVDLGGLGSARACRDALAGLADRRPGGVLDGHGWDEHGWPERRPLTTADIDRAAPGRTVLLVRVDAHACVVDRDTLAALPLDDLDGVERTADGAPTGLLRETASEAALVAVRARRGAGELRDARERACAAAAALGIGSLHEMGHPGLSGLDDALAWARGTWPVDVQVWWADLEPWWDPATGPLTAADAAAAGLRPGGDLFLDGSIGSHTAAVDPPYLDVGGGGVLFHSDEDVAALFVAATRAGVGAGVHAIGERAIAQAARALGTAARACGTAAVRRCRHRVEHLELPPRDALVTLGELGVVASVQPAFDALWGGDRQLYATRFGADRARASNPFATIQRHGLSLALGSDSTVTPLDPLGGVHAAAHHLGGEAVPREVAWRAHTVGGRHVAHQDDAGAVRPGWRADLAVWDGDPFAVDDVRTLSCLATVVGGRLAHGSW